jgi:hypothetical protein
VPPSTPPWTTGTRTLAPGGQEIVEGVEAVFTVGKAHEEGDLANGREKREPVGRAVAPRVGRITDAGCVGVVESRELSVRARVERTANARCACMVENGEERESLHMFDTDFLRYCYG